MKTYVGIDFGACDIKAAKISPHTKRVQIVKLNMNMAGSSALPAVIFYDKIKNSVEVKVGDGAKSSFDLDNKISRIIPKIARKSWSKYIPNLDREISSADALTDMLAKIWKHIARQAAKDENFDVTVTVPAAFSEVQKKIIKQAAINADVPISSIIAAPFAEIFSCDEFFANDAAQIVLIFDFGGTALDVNLFKIERTAKTFAVTELSAATLNYGGTNIDYSIFLNIFLKKYADIINQVFADDKAGYELIALIEKMKEEIFLDEEESSGGSLIDDKGNFFEFELTQQEVFNAIEIDGIKSKITAMLDDVLDDAGISPSDVDAVKVFGGTASIDYFLDILEKYFGEEIFCAEDFERDGITTGAAIGAVKYRCMTDEDSLRVKVKNIVPCGIYILRGDKFFRCIKRNELRGFVTPYKPILIDELKKNNWHVSFYQSYCNEAELPAAGDDAVFLGDIRLDSRLYTSTQAILFKMNINAAGQLCVKFFEDSKINGRSKITLVEEKILYPGRVRGIKN